MRVLARLLVAFYMVLSVSGLALAQDPDPERQLAVRVRQLLDQGTPDAVQAADRLMAEHLTQGRAAADATLVLAERLVRLKEQHAGPFNLDTAVSVRNLAAVHASRGEFALAV